MFGIDYEEKIIEAILKKEPDFFEKSDYRKRLDKYWKEILPGLTELGFKYYEEHLNEFFEDNKKDLDSFLQTNYNTWSTGFDSLECYIFYIGCYVSSIYDNKPDSKDKEIIFSTMYRLHGRAMQVAFEVLTLIKAGLPDGALARWRSLYEISIIALFLEDKPVGVYEKYLNHSEVITHREIEWYYKIYGDGKKGEILQRLNESGKILKDLKKQYGVEFVQGDYGWTSDYLSPRERNFKGIEKAVQRSFMRPYYKMANIPVHGGSKGFLFQIGMPGGPESGILAGYSNYGMTEPATRCAESLFEITGVVSSVCDTPIESTVTISILRKILDGIVEEFKKLDSEFDESESKNI